MREQRNKRGLGYFFAELVILVLGISASFILNEYRLGQQERKQEQDLLESYRLNLVTDSTELSGYIKIYEAQIEAATNILNLSEKANYTDSTAINVLRLLNYAPFDPTDITYQEMKSLGSSHIIQNDSLLSKIVGLYEGFYQNVTLWAEIDGEHVKQKVIPFIAERFPYVKNLSYQLMSEPDKRAFMKQVNSDQYRYTVTFSLAYKQSTKGTFEQALNEIKEVIVLIDSELEE